MEHTRRPFPSAECIQPAGVRAGRGARQARGGAALPDAGAASRMPADRAGGPGVRQPLRRFPVNGGVPDLPKLARLALFGLALALLTGCAAPRRIAGERPFQFGVDTFAYANELLWDYAFDAEGRWKGTARQPRPDYTHRCFVVVRSAKQFFQHARFDPAAGRVGEAEERRLLRRVLSRSPRRDSWPEERVVIPGYANLHEFSAARQEMFQEECGSFWQSYFQRGHWRMILPFSRGHQARTAVGLAREIARNRSVVVHLVSFPSLRINHAVLLFAVEEQGGITRFAAYDPNFPEKPTELTYDAVTRRFDFPTNAYFPGGRVKVYEVYCSRCY